MGLALTKSQGFTVILKPENETISGNMAPGHAGLVLRFIMTGESGLAVESQIVKLAVTATVLWKSGIMCLRSLTEMEKADTRN